MWNRERTYLTDLDWINAALDAICRGGINSVAVEPLARQLGVSKGSFYWHFDSRDALLQATLEHWEREEADAFITPLQDIPDPRERIRQLIFRVSRGSWNCALHTALSSAARHPQVRPVLQRISAKRKGYLASCYRELGFSEEDARYRARLGYTLYVGFIHLDREAADDEVPVNAEYVRHIVATLIPGSREADRRWSTTTHQDVASATSGR